jgi:hypothetical protein
LGIVENPRRAECDEVDHATLAAVDTQATTSTGSRHASTITLCRVPSAAATALSREDSLERRSVDLLRPRRVGDRTSHPGRSNDAILEVDREQPRPHDPCPSLAGQGRRSPVPLLSEELHPREAGIFVSAEPSARRVTIDVRGSRPPKCQFSLSHVADREQPMAPAARERALLLEVAR